MKNIYSTDKRPEFVMFVGIPGSGKSTFSEKYAEMGYTVLSSDVIRLEMAGVDNPFKLPKDELDSLNNAVFERIRRETAASLKQGISVVMDATNLARKRRMGFLGSIKHIACTKKCLLFITPREICCERNSRREGIANVPDQGMEKMFRSFECPYYWEGWDAIEPVADTTPYSFPFEETVDFDQMNPYHTLTLHGHLEAARAYAERNGFSERIQKIAYYHDIGKLYTRTFKNMRGEVSETAHYYDHENYSAFLYLAHMCCGKELSADEFDDILYEANLINCHMRPLNSWKWSDKAKEKDTALFGEDFISDLTALNMADTDSH